MKPFEHFSLTKAFCEKTELKHHEIYYAHFFNEKSQPFNVAPIQLLGTDMVMKAVSDLKGQTIMPEVRITDKFHDVTHILIVNGVVEFPEDWDK